LRRVFKDGVLTVEESSRPNTVLDVFSNGMPFRIAGYLSPYFVTDP